MTWCRGGGGYPGSYGAEVALEHPGLGCEMNQTSLVESTALSKDGVYFIRVTRDRAACSDPLGIHIVWRTRDVLCGGLKSCGWTVLRSLAVYILEAFFFL